MEDLIGEMVLVHPELQKDPAMGQGEVGIITKVDLSNDEITVAFGNQQHGLYASNALLAMKPAPELYKTLLIDGKNKLSTEEFKTVMAANLFQDGGKVSDLVKAFETLKSNPAALKFGTLSLEEKIQLATNHEYISGNDKSNGR